MSDEGQLAPIGQDQAPRSAHAMFSAVEGDGDIGAIGAPRRRKIPTTQITAAFVALIGGGSIYAMRQMGMKSGMDFEAKAVAFKSEFTPEDHARFQRVLRELELGDMLVQIPAASAGSNPFFIGLSREDTRAQDAAAAAAERERQRAEAQARQAAEARLAQISGALKKLRLGTIVSGRMPVATINNEVVRVGDTVEEVFTVVEILPAAVTLEADGVRYTLTPQDNGPGR